MPHKRTHNKTKRGHRLTVKADQPILLANGAKLRNGQIIGGEPMQKNQQRKLNSSMPSLNVGALPAAPQRAPSSGDDNLARSGAAKVTAKAQPVPGQRRQTPDSVFTGPGQTALEDEPALPLKSHVKPIPVHAGMTDRQRAAIHPVANDPHAILQNAADLGRSKPKPAQKA